jgi:hypothetical protein
MSDVNFSKYFPLSKIFALRVQITNFKQRGESLSKACDKYQELLRLSPHHGLENWFILQIFYECLEQSSNVTINAGGGCNLMNMSVRDDYKLIDKMTLGQQQWSSVRGPVRGAPSVMETSILTKLAAQLKAM